MKLSVAELFYSVQGEGGTIGAPSVFLRLAGCNLMCGGQGTQHDGQLHDGATWRCDTIEVWMKGKSIDIPDLVQQMRHTEGDMFHMLTVGAHLIITGGEPLMQMQGVTEFLQYLDTYASFAFKPCIEIETNGTIPPNQYLRDRVDHWNVSPKLANSGMPEIKRINIYALQLLARSVNRAKKRSAIFKFVVKDRFDWDEIRETYLVKAPEIKQNQIYLMPAVDNAEDYPDICQKVIEICKREVVNFSPREHIAVWNQKTGV